MKKSNKGRIPHQAPNAGRIIPGSATNEPEKTDDQSPSFRLTHADDNRYLVSSWKSEEIKDLIRALKKIERHTWAQIKSQGSKTKGDSVGCGYKTITNHPKLPDSISEDILLSEMRVCQTKRIFGFRIHSIYYIVWFDRTHEICK